MTEQAREFFVVLFYILVCAAALLAVCRIVLNRMWEHDAKSQHDNNEQLIQSMQDLILNHRKGLDRLMEQRDERYMHQLKERDTEYWKKFEELQIKIQNLSEKKTESVN